MCQLLVFINTKYSAIQLHYYYFYIILDRKSYRVYDCNCVLYLIICCLCKFTQISYRIGFDVRYFRIVFLSGAIVKLKIVCWMPSIESTSYVISFSSLARIKSNERCECHLNFEATFIHTDLFPNWCVAIAHPLPVIFSTNGRFNLNFEFLVFHWISNICTSFAVPLGLN